MTDHITTIKDFSVQVKFSEKLMQYFQQKCKDLNKNKLPGNLKNIIQNTNSILNVSDIECLNEYLRNQRKGNESALLSKKELDNEIEKILQKNYLSFDCNGFLKEKNKNLPYLHDLVKGSELVLPKNEVIKRNPILAERIEKLKKDQEEREYKKMTKNVDVSKKYNAEDTISYQMNMMNRHLIAVGQFLLSVGSGFAFGFFGVELILGDLRFGVKLLLGIVCAIAIALAEFYFLAKHLDEEDKEVERDNLSPSKFKTKVKLHKE